LTLAPDRAVPPAKLVADLQAGGRRALAQVLALLEEQRGGTSDLMGAMRLHLSGVPVIGFTGPPGAGKSTLINALISHWRKQHKRIAVIAVDPSSPISGGAILGDRIRMTSALDDDGVFVRSLASHGHLGGLSPNAARLIDAFDVAGYDLVLLETVGTGQNEIDIASVADISTVMVAPGLGDGIQAIKSGLLEIASILVVNKSDRPGAAETAQQLQAAMTLRDGGGALPEIVQTTALAGFGVSELAAKLDRLTVSAQAGSTAAERRLRRGRYIVERLMIERVRAALAIGGATGCDATVNTVIEDVLAARCAPDRALLRLLSKR
jgi:LAO/AO transport system kinase